MAAVTQPSDNEIMGSVTEDQSVSSGFGRALRQWRKRRGESQHTLSLSTGVSTRHLSCLETGRASPSREMVIRLADALEIPLRERNTVLAAAGFASLYGESNLDSPEMDSVNRVVDFFLKQHAPYPAVLMDRAWNILRMNDATQRCLAPFASPGYPFTTTPLNLLRITLHPDGLQRHLVNFHEVAYELLTGLHRAANRSGGARELVSLYKELSALPGVNGRIPQPDPEKLPVVIVPLHLKIDDAELRLFSAITVIGSAQDITLDELRIESLMPADDQTDAWIRAAGGPNTISP